MKDKARIYAGKRRVATGETDQGKPTKGLRNEYGRFQGQRKQARNNSKASLREFTYRDE